VVALKTRSISVADDIAQSLEALVWLRDQGAEQIYFKYCSTFDSTPLGKQAVQSQLGVERAGAMLEGALAHIACGLVAQGVRQLVVAGGEIQALARKR
jgi:uncharacterized protein YgbK (DUF1537 family)